MALAPVKLPADEAEDLAAYWEYVNEGGMNMILRYKGENKDFCRALKMPISSSNPSLDSPGETNKGLPFLRGCIGEAGSTEDLQGLVLRLRKGAGASRQLLIPAAGRVWGLGFRV